MTTPMNETAPNGTGDRMLLQILKNCDEVVRILKDPLVEVIDKHLEDKLAPIPKLADDVERIMLFQQSCPALKIVNSTRMKVLSITGKVLTVAGVAIVGWVLNLIVHSTNNPAMQAFMKALAEGLK